MGVQITIRNVPEEVRDELAVRAARNRQSMQAFLLDELKRLDELERVAGKPTIDEWLERVRKRRETSQSRVNAEDILRAPHADLR